MNGAPTGILLGRAEAKLTVLARQEAAIAMHGPRSVGESTTLRRFADQHGVEVIDLGHLVVRNAVAPSPSAITNAPTPFCIDEQQHALQAIDVG